MGARRSVVVLIDGVSVLFIHKPVHTRSDTELGNTQSAPRGGERATVC